MFQGERKNYPHPYAYLGYLAYRLNQKMDAISSSIGNAPPSSLPFYQHHHFQPYITPFFLLLLLLTSLVPFTISFPKIHSNQLFDMKDETNTNS